MNTLFAPAFNNKLTKKLLATLKTKEFPGINFDRFSSFSSSGRPMDPSNSEVFNVDDYLPELQFSFDLVPSVDFGKKTIHIGLSSQ